MRLLKRHRSLLIFFVFSLCAVKEKEAAALAELSVYDKKAVDACKEKMASFKANFEDLQKFVKEVIIANFDEFELSVDTQDTRA